jgi:hypothetical protein
MAHDQHDESYIRSHSWEYEGESWLGLDSLRAPRHDPVRDVSRGTHQDYGQREARAGRRSYR